MPLYIGDYLADTRRLTCEEHGAYLLLLMEYWRNGPLPNDDERLARIVGVSSFRWKRLRKQIGHFFLERGDKLIQKRAEIEMARASAVTEKRSNAGKIGAEARWQTDSDRSGNRNGNRNGNRTVLPMASDGPSQSHIQKEENLTTTLPVAARAEPSSDRRMSEANAIAGDFLALRDQGWPSEPKFPSPLATLRTQALAWIDAGATPALAHEVMHKACEEKRARGEPAPTNLGFCRLSMDTAIARSAADSAAAPPGTDPDYERAKQRPGSPEWSYELHWDRWDRQGRKGTEPMLETYRKRHHETIAKLKAEGDATGAAP
jgi:uncharacterized protein YdaU (DUF1376 family)